MGKQMDAARARTAAASAPRWFAARACLLTWAVVLMPWIAGCPSDANNVCSTNPCDDGDLCTTDTCTADSSVAGGYVCANTPVDCGDRVCNPTDGTCVGCASNADCDDGVYCNGAEMCDTTAQTCMAGMAPCAAGEVCVEDMSICAASCITVADCPDDGDVCTIESCIGGACITARRDCDDGLFCTGVEFCNSTDPAADAKGCVSPGDPCGAEGPCNEAADVCMGATPCASDSDCPDDGLYCTGTERCDVATGHCIASGDPCVGDDPCNPSASCNEDTNSCDSETIAVDPPRLTMSDDVIMISGGDATIDGSLEVNDGAFFNTLNDGDVIEGSDCLDTLDVQITGPTTVAPTALAGIDVINLQQTTGSPLILDAINADALTTINNANSATDGATVTVNNVATALTGIGWSNGAEAYTINLAPSALVGSADVCTITINNVVDPGDAGSILTIQPITGTNGYEVFTIDSTGSHDNVVQQLTGGTSATLNTIKVIGTAGLTINDTLDPSVTVVNAATSSGGVAVKVNSSGANTACTGGSGDDSFDFSAGSGAYNTSDTISGGGGTDTLILDDADALTTGTQSNVTGIEVIKVVTAGSGTVDVTDFGASKFISAAEAFGANQVTVPSGGTVEFDVDPTGNATIVPKTAGTSDALTLIMNAGWTGTCTLNGWETVNLKANVAPVTFSSTVTLDASSATESIVITGTQPVTFTGVTTCDVIDGSAMTGALTVAATGAVAQQITGGSASDSLSGSDFGDVISGVDGTDTIEGRGGDDTLLGGAGPDTFILEATAAANGSDTITDFTTSDMLDMTAFVGGDAPSGTIADMSNGNQVVASGEIWIVTDADGSIDTASKVALLFGGGGKPFAAGVGGMHVVVLVVDTQSGGSTRVWFVADADSNATVSTAECALVATLTSFNTPLVDANIVD